MRTLLTILLAWGFCISSSGICAGDDRTLTEMLFRGKPGTIFTCKVLTFSTPTYPDNVIVYSCGGSINGTAIVEITGVYFGNVDTNIVTLRAGSHMTAGKTYLIYTTGSGRVFSFGGNCDRWSKQITDDPATTNELFILKQFSDIFKKKLSGRYTFTNSKNVVLAEGRFKKGKAIKTWKHYYDNGTLKAEFDLNNHITSQYYANGFIKSRSTVNDLIGFYEQFSKKVNGQLTFTDKEVQNDTGMIMTVSEYHNNGRIKNLSSWVNINSKDGGSHSGGRTGEYKEYYDNGHVKVAGQYFRNKRTGLWKWYEENGAFYTEFDYGDGTGEQQKIHR